MKEKKKSKRLSLKKRIAFMAITLLLCFLILEAMMIVLEPLIFSGFFQYDPDLGFRVRSHARGSNRFGFCDREYPLERSPGTFRMLVVGDSFGWSGGREGNYTALLEKLYKARFGIDRFEVINSGYPMTHTGEQLAMLKKYGLKYNPDIVLLSFFVGNDFKDADPHRKRIVACDTYFDIDRRREFTVLGYPIVPKSRLYGFLKQKFIVLMELLKKQGEENGSSRNMIEEKKSSLIIPPHVLLSWIMSIGDDEIAEGAIPDRDRGPFTEDTILSVERNRLQFCNISLQNDGKYNDRINYIFQSIAGMKDLLEARNIQFVVAIFPDQFQVDETMLEKVLTKYNLRREDYDLEFMQKILREYLDSLDIPWIDLLDGFKEKGKETRLYKIGDTHWNRAGNQLAAQILLAELPKVVKPPSF